MKFAEILWLFLALGIIPACIALHLWGGWRRKAILNTIVSSRLLKTLVRSLDERKRAAKGVLFITAVALLLFSLARPLHGLKEAQIERAGVDVILALDVSRSMMAQDGPTNRLTLAKNAITRLLKRPSPDRYGLIIFSGEAGLIAPVTMDHQAVQRTVGSVGAGDISKPGTDLAAAIKLAMTAYDDTRKRGKALVLISDGEQLQGDAILAARDAAKKEITLFTVGVGTTVGARIPEPARTEKRFMKNEFGRDVVSRLNEPVMRQIAAAGHGYYAPLGSNGDGLVSISDRGISPLAKGSQVRHSKEMREYFQWPLGLAILLLLGEFLLGERRKNTAIQAGQQGLSKA
jgi:Ca-activated chloride channel family protein